MNRIDLESQMDVKATRIESTIPMSEMVQMLSYNIWGAAVTTTRAFENVSLKVDPDTARIFIAIKLRWWANFEKFKPLHEAWLRRAEKRVKEQINGEWRVLVYYDRGTK